MPGQFASSRLFIYLCVFGLAGTVLGLSAKFASVFLPNIHHDFTIFSIVVPSLTIFMFLILVQWSQPRIEVPVMFILMGLWLAMGAWSADIIGHVECFPLAGQRTETKNGGSMDARQYCYQMHVIEAFSWMLFVIIAFYMGLVIALISRIAPFNRHAWDEDIRYTPWFGQYPGYEGMQMGQGGYYGGQAFTTQNYGQPVQQLPGHSVIIQRGTNGQPNMVTQVPGTVTSA